MNSRNVFLSGHKRGYDLSLGCIVIWCAVPAENLDTKSHYLQFSFESLKHHRNRRAASKITTMM